MGRLRIIYRLSAPGRVVELLAIGPRARIYKDALRYVERDQKNRGSLARMETTARALSYQGRAGSEADPATGRGRNHRFPARR